MRQTTVVNIYNFIRMSHVEPSRFIADDFETLRNQLILVKQYGFPGTYALKYDALTEPRYQALLGEYLDEADELSAWWEITEPLCRRAGVPFRGKGGPEYDDRVDSAYSLGYAPEERKRLVDAYMADFRQVFGRYPQTIGSWVLDSVTLGYAAERYGVTAGAICRDQMGTDGFTLWGGYPNGAYYPCRRNEFLPAQTREEQLPVPMFRLLGPDPIYNFEAEVREGLQGVYTLEPSWLTGRDPKWISWLFRCLTEEDALGMAYAHVGQENNFLWENIRPGFGPQLEHIRRLQDAGKLRVETMADTARWFRGKYAMTPPMTFQASRDWDEARSLAAQWYACANYRLGFLEEGGCLRIRDLFLYREGYESRYLRGPVEGAGSTFDALPILFPQAWRKELGGRRPYITLRDERGREPRGAARFYALDDAQAAAELTGEGGEVLARFTMDPAGVRLEGPYRLVFDYLPGTEALEPHELRLRHRGFPYGFRTAVGLLLPAGRGLEILPEGGEIRLELGENAQVFTEAYLAHPADWDSRPAPEIHPGSCIPPFAPEFSPAACVFDWGTEGQVRLTCREPGEIRYTLDGTEPGPESPLYTGPIVLERDTVLSARLFLPDGRSSGTVRASYRFGWKDMVLRSPTVLDARPVFSGGGLGDLLLGTRGSLDYLDGHWRGTLENLDVTGIFPAPLGVKSISVGFLSHHRSGIVYPACLELYTGPDEEHLTFLRRVDLPCAPGAREIEKQDVSIPVGETIGAFRLVARRYVKMPQWCCYRGTSNVFTMADALIVTPGL